jgi:hypothetical protein
MRHRTFRRLLLLKRYAEMVQLSGKTTTTINAHPCAGPMTVPVSISHDLVTPRLRQPNAIAVTIFQSSRCTDGSHDQQ